MLRVGLLGAGRIGRVHAASIANHPHSRLAAVADMNAAAASELASQWGAVSLSTEAVLGDPDIDAVLIATSTDTHADLIEAATAEGKAVLCEKPVDLDLTRALACMAVTSARRPPVMIGFNRRFDSNFVVLKAALDAGSIGKGELLSITSYDPAPPPISYVSVSGGLFRDMAIHDFDMACWLFGAVPEKVTAVGTSVIDPAIGAAGDVDTAISVLHFADGRLAEIRNSRRAVYGYDQRIELLGEKGLLSAGNVRENTVEVLTSSAALSAKPEYFFLERYARAYEAEWSGFVRSVLDGAKPPVSLQDGVNALAVAEAATQAARREEAVAIAPSMLGA